MQSLIPPRQIAFSAELAATLGLEEAVLVQCLADERERLQPATGSSSYQWFLLSAQQLKNRLPFWSNADVQRIAENLRQQGVILVSSAPLTDCGELRYAFNETAARGYSRARPAPDSLPDRRANIIAPNWQPDGNSEKRLAQHGVPLHFAQDQVAEFVQHWSERGEARYDWGSKFLSHVLQRWRTYESRQQQPARVQTPPWEQPRENEAHAITRDWKPSEDALNMLENTAGIHRNFIEDALPEFILYWSENGDLCNTWSTRFYNHVKRQWAEFQHSLKNERKPSVMTEDWQPSADLYQVIDFAQIDRDFAKSLVPEFVLYWRDRNEIRPSWNTLFLQYAKRQWQRRSAATTTRERSLVEDLTDRSWAH